jgi:hypothetical protein
VTEIGLETERITNKGKARATTSEKEIEQVPNSSERPSTPRPKENEYSGKEDSLQAYSCPRTTSTAICARTVPTGSPTSIYSTSSTIQREGREGREGAEEDNQSGGIKDLGVFSRVATAQVRHLATVRSNVYIAGVPVAQAKLVPRSA